MRKPIHLPESFNKTVVKIGISVGVAGAQYTISPIDPRSSFEGALDYVLNLPERLKVFVITFSDGTKATWEWNVQQAQYAPLV